MATILVVDDEMAVLGLFETLLSQLGHKCSLSINGKHALDILEKQRFDLVLSDIMMPGMDGINLLRHIRANPDLRHTKVVLMSDVLVKKPDVNPDKHVQKPYTLEAVQQLLDEILNS
jgi:CheY-like chemotaxis protein